MEASEKREPDTGKLADLLKRQVRGRVVTPADPDFDDARTLFYGGFDQRPAAIVRAADSSDILRTIALAREQDLELAVRSGGHSVAGHSLSEGGLVLDLRDLRMLEIKAAQHTAWVEPGLTTAEYTAAAGVYGLATGFGDTGSVAVGGLTLGGGVGYLVRKHGLTIDSLQAAVIATADGKLLRADPQENPDLFWAIRGGGGNFGVATRFQFQLHPVDKVFGGLLVLPALPDVIAGFMAAADRAPDELSSILNVMTAPPMPFLPAEFHGKLVAMAMLVYAGDPAVGESVIAPFKALAKPLADLVRPMRWPEIYPREESGGYHPLAVSRTMFLDRVDLPTAREIVARLEASDAPLRVAQLRPLGGAMARVPVEATAFAHRNSRVMANLAAFYNGPEDKPQREEWVNQFYSAVRQNDAGAYINFVSAAEADSVRAAYPGLTWERLAAIKARYDPTNLFRRNHNIPPA